MEDWAQKVDAVIARLTRVDGRVPSHRTVDATREVIYNAIRTLHDPLGYRVQDPTNIGDRHLRALIRHKVLVQKRSAKTIQNYVSRLNVFFTLLGKSNLVLKAEDYVPEVDPSWFVVRTAAKKSKGLTANGIDVAEVIHRADALNERFGLMVRMILAFGLRREEVLHCRPWVADHGTHLRVYPGEGKNGRPRDIPAFTEFQRETLKEIQSKFGKQERMGWKLTSSGQDATLKQNLTRLKNYATRAGLSKLDIGSTLHSIRAQWMESEALRMAFVPTTLGGTSANLEKDEYKLRLTHMSESAGHGRISVGPAYYGPLHQKCSVDDREAFRKIMLNAAAALAKVKPTVSIPEAHCEDVLGLLFTLLTEDGVEIYPSQAYQLWKLHSSRFGVDWVAFEPGVRQALEAAARLALTKHASAAPDQLNRPE